MADHLDARMEVHQGDITQLDVDAIVNAANADLRPGGGVCGAIHRAAGPDLAHACAKIGGCPTGTACATEGFKLKARHIIHTAGPVWHGGGHDEAGLLASCYRMSLKLARDLGARSVAFPAISTGVYGFPLKAATKIAVRSVNDILAEDETLERVVFCVFGQEAEGAYRAELDL